MGDHRVNVKQPKAPDPMQFLNAAGKLAEEFGWPAKSSERGSEVVLVAATNTDPSFERFVWVYDTERTALRCMLVGKQRVPAEREAAILELCARVNEALPFACLEYSFSENVLVCRDSADLDWGPLDHIVSGTTARVLNLGRRYADAIASTLKGTAPADAVAKAEAGG